MTTGDTLPLLVIKPISDFDLLIASYISYSLYFPLKLFLMNSSNMGFTHPLTSSSIDGSTNLLFTIRWSTDLTSLNLFFSSPFSMVLLFSYLAVSRVVTWTPKLLLLLALLFPKLFWFWSVWLSETLPAALLTSSSLFYLLLNFSLCKFYLS